MSEYDDVNIKVDVTPSTYFRLCRIYTFAFFILYVLHKLANKRPVFGVIIVYNTSPDCPTIESHPYSKPPQWCNP